MYNVRKSPKTNSQKLKNLGRKSKAVSPVVATLILIIVAIIGAISVGLIVSGIGTSTSGSANKNISSAGNGQFSTTLTIGGSTTVFPLDEAAIPTFENTYHINVVDAQGGSDAGMQGVIQGTYNIGAASSVGAVNNAINDVSNNNIQGVTINPILLGGSAIVVIENGPGTNGMLVDGTTATTNECLGVTKAALDVIFEVPGSFGIISGACAAAGPTYSTLDSVLTGTSTTICAGTAGTTTIATGPAKGLILNHCTGTVGTDTGSVYNAVSRNDNSGTQDQFASYTGLPKQSASGNYPGTTEVGNPGVLNYVNTHLGTIGFVDLGFAEGAPSTAVCGAGWSAGLSCGVALPQVISSTPGQLPIDAVTTSVTNGVTFTLASGTTTAYDGYVGKDQSTSNVHNAIVGALKAAANVNPATLAGAKSIFPDTVEGTTTTGLARTFYYVTNGTPTATEQQWISFMTSYNAETYFQLNGYFTTYDFTSA